MLLRHSCYSICVSFGVNILLILVGSIYAEHSHIKSSSNVKTRLKIDGEENYSAQLQSDNAVGVPEIEKILEAVRSDIKASTAKYNFSYSGVHALEDLVLESGGKPLKSIIASTWRSGTTFLGEILNELPGTFYHFEPLIYYRIVQIRGPPESQNALSAIKNILKCDFHGMNDYFAFGKTLNYQFIPNKRLWDHCKNNRQLCNDPDFTSRFCKLFPFQTMKLVRLRLRFLQEVLDDTENNVKVILLIRDPRGVMQSRQHASFCRPSPDCWRPDLLCADMVNDHEAASNMLSQYPDKLMVLRFEELALDPYGITARILKFLKLSASTAVDEYLQTHTKYEVSGLSSTFRVTQNVPFKWKNMLNFTYVDEIQNSCKEAMELWGYRMADNATHMTSKEFIPMQNYTLNHLVTL